MKKILATTLFIGAALMSSQIQAQEFNLQQAHIIVEGQAEITAKPDIVTLSLSVEETASNFTEAKNIVDKAVNNIIKTAEKNGIHKKDINASQINAHPEYEWQNNKRIYRGERVNRQVTLILRNTNNYNHLVDALLKTGLERIDQSQLSFSNRNSLENNALTLALDDAKQQAEVIAKHLGNQITGVYQIVPMSRGQQVYHMEMRTASMKANDAGGMHIGDKKIEKAVKVIYLIK